MASSGGSSYFHFVDPKRQNANVNDVTRGLQAGEGIGKALSGLADAIKSSQANAAANKLMNTENAPRAALVNPGGTYVPDPGGPQPASGDGGDPDPDPYAIDTPPSTFVNPATGNVEPVQGTGGQQIVFPDPTVATNAGAAKTAASLTNNAPYSVTPQPGTHFVPNAPVSPNVSTAGTKPFTGGVEGMKVQQEFQKSQLEQQAAQAKAADELAKRSGTGQYATEAALQRVKLQQAQSDLLQSQTPKPAAPKVEKNPPAVNIGSEPVVDQNQLNNHIDGIYGKGTANSMASSINEPQTLADGSKNPAAPVYNADGSVTILTGPNKKVTIPLAEAQTYIKQANALRLKQGLPAYKVPGEDPTVGSSAANPYPAKNNLDVYSRPPGTWVRLPNNKVAQVPNR